MPEPKAQRFSDRYSSYLCSLSTVLSSFMEQKPTLLIPLGTDFIDMNTVFIHIYTGNFKLPLCICVCACVFDRDLLRISSPALKWGRFSSDLHNKQKQLNLLFQSMQYTKTNSLFTPHNAFRRVSFGQMGAFWSLWSATWWFYGCGGQGSVWGKCNALMVNSLLHMEQWNCRPGRGPTLTLAQNLNHQLVFMLWLIGSCSLEEKKPLWNMKKAKLICVALRTNQKIKNGREINIGSLCGGCNESWS